MSFRPSSVRPLVVAGCATLLFGGALLHLSRQSAASRRVDTPASELSEATAPSAPEPRNVATFTSELRALLADTDPAKRTELLRAWADGIDTAFMPEVLAALRDIDDPLLRNEARQALLYSWTSRDLVAVAKWFGTLGPAYDLQQEGRDQLVSALLECDPEEVVAVLQSSLPPTTSQQLYGPYFRAWAATAPETAGAKLVALSAAETGNPRIWHDLIAQVAAQWIETDVTGAVAWIRSIPEGPAKTKAELQTAYRWTEADPVAASAYAAEARNLQLVKTVAGKWAEANPSAALAWGETFPDPLARARALSGAAVTLAQSDPGAAAAYAARIADDKVRADVAASVAGAWAFNDPEAAGAWVRSLPADASRDLAVGVLCDALRFTEPDQAFAWAGAITDAELREHTISRVAVGWLKQAPDAAREAISRSALSAELKSSIFDQATPPKSRG